MWFWQDITTYNKFSIEQLRRWIGTARDFLKRFQLNQRKKANQRQIQYNSIEQRVYSTNIVGRIPLIHNIVKVSPIVFKRKRSILNMLLYNKTIKNMKETSTKKQSNNIAKKTVNIRESETAIPRIHISTNNDSTVLPLQYKQQQCTI